MVHYRGSEEMVKRNGFERGVSLEFSEECVVAVSAVVFTSGPPSSTGAGKIK